MNIACTAGPLLMVAALKVLHWHGFFVLLGMYVLANFADAPLLSVMSSVFLLVLQWLSMLLFNDGLVHLLLAQVWA